MNTDLKNENVFVSFNEENSQISGTDLTDPWNIPRFYTTKKRNIKKAWDEIEKSFNDSTTESTITKILFKYNLGPRSYCAMD